jgi:hypothetical protein
MRSRKALAAISTLGLLMLVVEASAANKETINTVAAYSGQHGVRVDVFCRNEVGLLEYFNFIVFDDTKLEFVSIGADRGVLAGGIYPTHVDGNRVYVHGSATSPTWCIGPDLGDPGSALFHVVFNVKPGVDGGLAAVNFSTEGIWDGHWNDCSGYTVSPTPDYYSGGIDVLGHAGHLTIEADSAAAGEQAVVDVYLHNDLDVFEYFHQILFEDVVADVDSIVAASGYLHFGNYPTHVSGDTIFVHGWAGNGGCFYADHSYPGAALYRIYITLHESAPAGYTMPLTYTGGSPIWDHWVGCDLTTTDSFGATDGSVRVLTPTGIEAKQPVAARTQLGQAVPNPTTHGARVSYYLADAGQVSVAIYNAAGQRVTTLERGYRGAGWHTAEWDGTLDAGGEVPSGVYFYRLQTGATTLSRKLVVVR